MSEQNLTDVEVVQRKGTKIILRIVVIVGILFLFFYLFTSYLMKQEDKEFIACVKQGEFDAFPGQLIGEVFEIYFENGKWIHWEDKNHHVEFRGDCEVDGEKTYVVIWFNVDERLTTFEVDGGFVGTNPEWLEIEEVICSAYLGTEITEELYGD